MLTVPVPQLGYDPLAPSVAAAELPLSVAVGAVVADDGTTLTPVELDTFSLLTYRVVSPLAPPQVWDPDARQWVAEGAPTGPVPLAYLPDQPLPWQALVVAAGARDAAGQPQFANAVGDYPAYSFRAFFVDPDAGAWLSGPSAQVRFASLADRNLMVLGPGDGELPDNATQARLQLRDPGLALIGGLVVRRDSPGAEVTLSNSAGASVVLEPDGGITLRPAAGRRVVVAGDLETDHITYLPAGGGSKQPLV